MGDTESLGDDCFGLNIFYPKEKDWVWHDDFVLMCRTFIKPDRQADT